MANRIHAPSRPAVSLGEELETIRLAVDGARLLAHRAEEQTGTGAQQTAYAIEAVLTLVRCRLRDLDRAIRGESDPALLVGPHNKASSGADERDVLLLAWSEEELEVQLSKLIERVERMRG